MTTYSYHVELPQKVIDIVRLDPDRVEFEHSLKEIVENGKIPLVYGCKGAGKSYTIKQLFPDYIHNPFGTHHDDFEVVGAANKPFVLDELQAYFEETHNAKVNVDDAIKVH